MLHSSSQLAMPENQENPQEKKEGLQKTLAASSLFPLRKKAQIKKDAEISSEALDNWNISLMIDTYDDIFSDFDARHISQRALSQDFLEECKRASIGKVEKGLEIRIMVPSGKRNEISEGLIKQRLKRHFSKAHKEKLDVLNKVKTEGKAFTAVGMLFLFLGGIVYTWEGSLLTNLILVILEPGGWFLAWTGLETLRSAGQKVPDLDFYRKMTEAEFIFIGY